MPRRTKSSESLVGWYVLIVPLLIVLAVVEFYPLISGIQLSFTDANGNFSLANYQQMISDPAFYTAIEVSVGYALGSTIVCILAGLGLAFLITQRVKGRSTFEALFIFPMAVSPILAGVLWSPSSIWDDFFGFTHYILGFAYIDELSPVFFYPVMIVSEAWLWSPLIMLTALSIINSRAKQIGEAAELHGATDWQRFTHVDLPLVLRSPVMQFIVVLRLIDSLRAFEIPLAWSNWVGFQSSIGSAVDTMSLFLYKLIFVPLYHFPVGLVSAIGVALLAVTLIIAFGLITLLGKIGVRF